MGQPVRGGSPHPPRRKRRWRPSPRRRAAGTGPRRVQRTLL